MILLVVATSGLCSETRFLKSRVPYAVANVASVGRLDGSRRMDLAIGLPLRNREGLINLLAELYNPASPNYRRYLSPQEFAARFGPTEMDYQSVIAFANSNHFVVTCTHPNRMLLDVNAAAGDIEAAFHVHLRVYNHPREQRVFFSPDVDPSVDASIPILSIDGLDDFAPPRPMDLKMQLHRMPPDARPVSQAHGRFDALADSDPQPALDATGSGPAGTFIGSDFRAAYAPGVSLDGAGESVGLVALDSYYPDDVLQYEELAGLRHVPITNVLVKGFNRSPGLNNGEVALDISMVISMAPGLDRVIVYEGTSGNDVLNRMATDNLARQLSCSWSFGNPIDPTRTQILQQFAAQGQSIFQASGDAGAYGTVVASPADDPLMTAVGGTSLATTKRGGAWASETAWFASGGGISERNLIPTWQKPLDMTTNLGSSTFRNVPDVAALADATIWLIANNGEQGTVAGTSAATPLWAGFAALVNQQAAVTHQPAIGFLNPAIYAIGQGPAYASSFHDITSGNNTNADSPDRFFAAAGYDLCTGWGSPNGSNLITALLAPSDALQITPIVDQPLTGPVGGPFLPALKTYSLTNTSGTPLSWAMATTSTWLNVSPQSGNLEPGGSSATLNASLNSIASNTVPGSYSADLWFTNLNDGFPQHRQIRLSVVTKPVINQQPSAQILPAGSTATFNVQTVTNAVLTYQWQANGTNLADGDHVAGTGTSVLTINNVSVKDSGLYRVIVTNVAGLVLSSGALLTVTTSPPVIVTEPLGQTLLPGATATLSATAVGDAPLTYQWLRAGTNLADSKTHFGSHSNQLLLSSVSLADAGIYSVIVSNKLGARQSADAEIKVVTLTAPEILQASLYGFHGPSDGGHPSGLTRGRDGKIYGVSQTGGTNDSGTIFRLDPAGMPQVLYSFSGLSDGELPNGGLVQSTDGSLLGTTYGGGSNGFGTIFRLRTNGVLNTLFNLDHTNGVLPTAGIVQRKEGTLLGTCYEGGILHYGTVFQLQTNGQFDVLFPFNQVNGSFPHGGLTLADDGSFYGTTYKGGTYGFGAVFRITPGGVLSTIASLNNTNGAFPSAGLAQASDGSIYGTTTFGGASALGAIFRISPDGVLTNLVSFNGATNGSHPRGALFQGSDGNLYGTTSDGGSFDVGTVFRLTPGGSLTKIAEFDGFNGANPESSLIEDEDGNLLGTARNGGPDNQGVIFRLSIPASLPQITSDPASTVAYAGSTVKLSVAVFGSSPLLYQWRENGTNLIESGNVSDVHSRILTLTNVDPSNAGNYSVVVSNAFGSKLSASASLQVLVSPPFITLQPASQTLSPGSNALFVAKALGNSPLAFQWQMNGTNLIDHANVSGSTTDTLSIPNVTEANSGTYVLTVTNALGFTNTVAANLSVIPVTAPGTSLNTLHWFTGGSDGRNPSGLVDGRDGYLYGTTQFGGTYRDGTVFRIGTNGALATLVSFDQTNGAFPLSGLVLSTNGDFYGTTSSQLSTGSGTIFRMSPTGSVATLYTFSGENDGGSPNTPLVQGFDGNFYGSTLVGGTNGFGTLFRITDDGVLTSLHSFDGALEGSNATGPLVQLPDGSFYGATAGGGVSNAGSVFRLSTNNILNNVFSFTGGTDGSLPVGGLALGDDGALYGATRFNSIRGFAFYGTFFRLTTNGNLGTLYSLNFTDGSYPAASLILGSDGNFYGTTEQGGANDFGTIFRMTPGGAVSTMVEFDGFDDGAKPLTPLTQGPDGNFYGTTSAGGLNGRGTVFRLQFTGTPQITGQPAAQLGLTGGKIAFSIAVTGGSPFFYEWRKDGVALTNDSRIQGAAARVLTINQLALSDAGSYSVVVSNNLGSVASASALLTIQAAPPFFQTSVLTNTALSLSWTSVPGRVYQLQFETDLKAANWKNFGNQITATRQTVQISIPISTDARQFYRVVLLP